MFVAFGALAVGGYTHSRGVFILASMAYVYIAVSALRMNRWMIGISVFIAAVAAVYSAPTVITNTWLFLTGHELFVDSPSTILVIALDAAIFALPATILSILYLLNSRSLARVFRIEPRDG